MDVEVIVRIDGREVAQLAGQLDTAEALPLEEQTEQIKHRLGQVLLEVAFEDLAHRLRHPCCCGRRMENKGRRLITLASHSGEITFSRNRYRCRECGDWQIPADAVICCGRHRLTRLLARNICQLATLEHFTRLEPLLSDQHGVHLGHEAMLRLVHDVGGALEQKRLTEVEHWRNQAAPTRHWPAAEIQPRRVYVSCDGIMYCTNETEPDPLNPDQRRLIWKQMRVGCVYWQDDQEHWHKRVIWGQEEEFLSFGAALYRLACRCGYRQATEKIFAADGGEWCWTIHQTYFADARGVLDWYHASEHVWTCGQTLHSDVAARTAWAEQSLTLLREQGGVGLLNWLLAQQAVHRGQSRRALQSLINYLQPRLDRTDYPAYRAAGWQIGTGMMESTAKQLVAVRMKGPGMHWCRDGATAVTALRAYDLNGEWHSLWQHLSLAT
jgi:hypothetical protein